MPKKVGSVVIKRNPKHSNGSLSYVSKAAVSPMITLKRINSVGIAEKRKEFLLEANT